MYRYNFCSQCGVELSQKRWRFWHQLCEDCIRKNGWQSVTRPLTIMLAVAFLAFALGRYWRPGPPPLLIQRAANSPLSDSSLKSSIASGQFNGNENSTASSLSITAANAESFICGARTKKGTPCQRRVHSAGERCFQHRGLPAILPPEKLTLKPKS